jgi:preprotein translocase subunit SecE
MHAKDSALMTTEATERDNEGGKGVDPVTFFRQVQAEGRKVTWATRQEVTVATIMVLILSIVAAIFFFAVDAVLGAVVRWMLQMAGG